MSSVFCLKLLCFCAIFFNYAICTEVVQDVTKNGTMRIELKRQKSAFEQHLNAPDLTKYGIDFPYFLEKKHHKGNRTNDSIALRRYLDNEFYGEIVIGHPGQKLNVAFDTAWTESWVLSSRCSSWKSIGCWLHNKYNHDKSSEWKKDGRPFNVRESKYNFTGFYSYDNISIAHSNVTNQSFVEMTSVPYTFIFNKIDGVLGLGVKTGSYVPFFYTLVQQKKIKDPIFSVYLNRDRQSSKGGNIILGYIETRHIHKTNVSGVPVPDEILYLDIQPGQYWQFKMDRIYYVNGTVTETPTICPNGCNAIPDTSSNSIQGPKKEIDEIHDKMGASYFVFDRWKVPCDTVNKLPILIFEIGGKNHTLKGPDYIVKLSYSSFTVCLSALVPGNYDFWVLGGAFLSEYYTVYDLKKKQIGIVKSV